MVTQPGLKTHVQTGLRNLTPQVKRNLLALQYAQAQESKDAKPEKPVAKTLAEREREVTARELRAAVLLSDLEAREATLASYAEEVAVRETIVAEREAKQGIPSQAPGVATAVFAMKEREEDKVRREAIRRKAALAADEQAFEQELQAKSATQKKLEREAVFGAAEGVMLPII